MPFLVWLLALLGLRRLGGANATTEESSKTDTEFTAEVVRILLVKPHANADRLEIAQFELKESGPSSYEVVIQKGAYVPGDLAAYFSVDTVLPTSHSEFAFLKQPGSNKELHRLRAAKLRGVFSQGLLVDVPDGFAFGDSVVEHFGVTYHRTAIEEDRGPTPPTPAKATAITTQAMPVYGVASLKKLPTLFADGEPVAVTEKIHGCNFRFGWMSRRIFGIPFGYTFVVGSHRALKGKHSKGTEGYYKEDLWYEAAKGMDLARRTKAYKGYTFYGELYGHTYSGKPIQDLTYGRKPDDGPALAVFDVLLPGEKWAGHFHRKAVLADLDLPGVPVLHDRTEFGVNVFDAVAPGLRSTLDAQTIREGIVVESHVADCRKKAKYVGEDYLMRKGA